MSLSLDLSRVALEQITEQLPVGIIIHDGVAIRFANPALLQMLAYQSSEEVLGRDPLELACPEDRGMILGRIRNASNGTVSEPLEERLLRKDGSTAYAEVSGVPVSFQGRGMVMAIFRDVSAEKAAALEVSASHQRQAELLENLRQVQKMEVIGQLAGGIAHDFNNLLTVILGHCQLLMERFADDRQALEGLKEIQDSGELAAAMTRKLLGFAHKQASKKSVLDLGIQVLSGRNLLRRLLPESIELEMEVDPGAVWACADPSEIEQILMNLSVNARDAMPQGGQLRIWVSQQVLGADPALEKFGLGPGRYAVISVKDQGTGMSEAIRARIFEPFFTTKGPGKGTGLGLATVVDLLKGSRGGIRVASEPGRGSCFEVYLPLVEPFQASAPGMGAQPCPGMGRGEKALLVEDQPALRRTVAFALREKGYRVLEASSGAQALSMLEELDELPGLLITDLVMPGMSGWELSQKLRARFGIKKALFISGYTDPSILLEGFEVPKENFFQKPMRLDRLAQRVRELFDSEEAL